MISPSPGHNRIAQVALLTMVSALLLAPVWLVRYPPLVDYPNHLARYLILAHLKDPSLHLAQFYGSRWGFYPYVAVDLLAVALQWLLPIDIVGRVILSIYLLGLPLATYFFLRQIGCESSYLSSWALVIACGPVFLSGILNDMLSEVLCFLLLGLWLKYLTKPRVACWLALLMLGTLLYLTHLVGFVVAGFVVLTYGLLKRQSAHRLLASLSIFLPGVLLHLWSFVNGTGADVSANYHPHHYQWELGDKFALMINPFREYSRFAAAMTLAALMISLVLAVWKNRELRPNYPWSGVAGAVLLVYLLTPTSYHYLGIRLLPFLFILSLSVAKIGRRARVLGVVGLLAFVLRSADMDYGFISRQAELGRWQRSFAAIPQYSRVLPMVPLDERAFFRRDYLHFWAYGVIERGWFCPHLFHAPGIHPLVLQLPTDKIARLLAWPKASYLEPGWNNVEIDPDWQSIQRNFEYLWVYDMPRFSTPIASFGQLVYSDGTLNVFRVTSATSAGSR